MSVRLLGALDSSPRPAALWCAQPARRISRQARGNSIGTLGGAGWLAFVYLPLRRSVFMAIIFVEPVVNLKFRDATLDDVPVIAALQNAAAGALTARFGVGHWSTLGSERSAALAQRHARVRLGRGGKRILTVLRLATKKPWAIDVSYFTPVKRPLYLTGIAVSVAHQGEGLGTLAVRDAAAVARDWPADAIRLDAYDAVAGAGPFYAKCGFQERGRVVYK